MMKTTLLGNKWLFALCLIASLAVGACSDDNDSKTSDPVIEADAAGSDIIGDDSDAGQADTGQADTKENDASQPDADDGDADAEGTSEPACDLDGFVMPEGDLVMEEINGGWSAFINGSNRALSLFLSSEDGSANVGTVAFQDVPFEQQKNILLIADQCTPLGCEIIYMAIAGTLDISVFEQQEEGTLQGTFSGLELVEINTTDSSYTRIEDGKLWCIDSLEFAATTSPRDTFPDTVSCDHSGFPAPGNGNGETLARTANGGEALLIDTSSQIALPHNVMALQIYGGTPGAATEVGTYQLDDFNYATCTNCLLVYTDCTQDSCAKTFIAGSGELEVTSTGQLGGVFAEDETFAATLSNAELVEVSIDPNTYEARLVEGGESWCISQFTWQESIQTSAQ